MPGGDVIVIRNGAAFTDAEVCEALRDCAGDLGFTPSLSDYLGWTRRGEVRERDGRRPTSQGTFTRLFGSYAKALIAAKLVNGEAGAAAIVRGGVVRSASYFVSDQAIQEGIQEVAAVLGRSPRVTEYERERLRVSRESVAAGEPRSLPSYGVIQRRYGTWDAALVASGLQALGGRHTQSNKMGPRAERAEPQISDAHMLDDIREAHLEVGEPFTVEAYKSWRSRTLKDARDRGEDRQIASQHTIWKRHGSWDAAKKAALSEGVLVEEPAADSARPEDS